MRGAAAGTEALVAGWGLVLPGHHRGSDDAADLPAPDRARLRRMDRFARAGFLAGVRAALAAGFPTGRAPDAHAGVVFGSAYGCRDSITAHAASLRAAGSVDDLRPAVFAQTVHNTVCGELAISLGFAGPSETFVSGRCAGLEAIVEGAHRVREGAAEAILAGGAEGLDDEMRALHAARAAASGPAAVEAAGALLLVRPGAASLERPVRVAGGACFREPDPARRGERLLESLRALVGGRAGLLVVATPEEDRTAPPLPAERTRWLSAEAGDLLGAAGAVGAVLAAESIAARLCADAAVVARGEAGDTVLLVLSS